MHEVITGRSVFPANKLGGFRLRYEHAILAFAVELTVAELIIHCSWNQIKIDIPGKGSTAFVDSIETP